MENKKVLIEDTLEGFEEELFNKVLEGRLEEEIIMEKELEPMILLEGEVKIAGSDEYIRDYGEIMKTSESDLTIMRGEGGFFRFHQELQSRL